MRGLKAKEIFSIPNLMGYFRILLIPVFCYTYIAKEKYLLAAGIVLLSGLTDLFDGLVARKFNMVTELGKALDPIADKLTHAALAVCLAVRYPSMWALIGLMAIKEGYMGFKEIENRVNASIDVNHTVIATGGLAKKIVPHCRREIILDDDLLLKGLAIIYKKNRK